MSDKLWLALFCFTILWYVVVTAIVAFRGAQDIRSLTKKDPD